MAQPSASIVAATAPQIDLATAPTPSPVQAAVSSGAQTAKELIAEFCRRFFSEARALARTKSYMFLAYLGFVGLGFTLKIAGTAQPSSSTRGVVEFILASPDTAAILGALGGLCFVVGGNLFSRAKASATRLRLFELAANPATPQDVRQALLKDLEGR
jgi:hypothetical protein